MNKISGYLFALSVFFVTAAAFINIGRGDYDGAVICGLQAVLYSAVSYVMFKES